MKKDVHSGLGGGLMAESFRIMNHMLNDLEDVTTGKVLLPSVQNQIPEEYKPDLYNNFSKIRKFNWDNKDVNGKESSADFLTYTDSIWKPSLSCIATDSNIPLLDNAGNVLRKYSTFRFEMQTTPLSKNNGESLKKFVSNHETLYNA